MYLNSFKNLTCKATVKATTLCFLLICIFGIQHSLWAQPNFITYSTISKPNTGSATAYTYRIDSNAAGENLIDNNSKNCLPVFCEVNAAISQPSLLKVNILIEKEATDTSGKLWAQHIITPDADNELKLFAASWARANSGFSVWAFANGSQGSYC